VYVSANASGVVKSPIAKIIKSAEIIAVFVKIGSN